MALIELNEEDKRYYSVIISYIGLITIYSGFTLLLPLLLLFAFPQEINLLPSFVIPSILSLIFGYILWRTFRLEYSPSFEIRHSAVIVTFGWILAILFGSLPFYLSGEMSFLNSIFEAVSGWSTTGLTMVVNENTFPHLLLFWRSLMQLIGGAGLAVLMLTAIVGPTDIESGMVLSEGREEKLLPSVASTTKLIVKIYVLYVTIGVILYLLAGMGWFDSLNHSMCAFSTGGFSTKDSSIGAFSIQIQFLTIFFMIFGNLNFALHYEILKGNLKELIMDAETKLFYGLLIIFIPFLYLSVFQFKPDISYSLVHGVFQTISALTTTGYMTQGAHTLLAWGGFTYLPFVYIDVDWSFYRFNWWRIKATKGFRYPKINLLGNKKKDTT